MSLDATHTLVGIAVGVCTLAAAMFAFVRWVRPTVRQWNHKRQQRDAVLIGRPAVIDPASGRELAPKYPGVGELVADLTDSVKTLTHRVLEDHESRIQAVEGDVKELKGAAVERIVSRAESAAAFRAMEAAAKAHPDEDAEYTD